MEVPISDLPDAEGLDGSEQIPLVQSGQTKKATVSAVQEGISIPTGVVLPYAGAAAPPGYLLCDGAAVSRADYLALFSVVGETYGPGDGVTTFSLPDCRGATWTCEGTAAIQDFVRGVNQGSQSTTLNAGQMPAHTHTMGLLGTAVSVAAGLTSAQGTTTAQSGTKNTGSAGVGQAIKIQPKTWVGQAIIKT